MSIDDKDIDNIQRQLAEALARITMLEQTHWGMVKLGSERDRTIGKLEGMVLGLKERIEMLEARKRRKGVVER